MNRRTPILLAFILLTSFALFPVQVAGVTNTTIEQTRDCNYYIPPGEMGLLTASARPTHYRTVTLDNGTEFYFFNMTVLHQEFNLEFNGSFLFEILYCDYDYDSGTNATFVTDYSNVFNITESNSATISYSRYLGTTFTGVGRDTSSFTYYLSSLVFITSLEDYPINVSYSYTVTYDAWLVTDPSEMPESENWWGWPAGNTTRYDQTDSDWLWGNTTPYDYVVVTPSPVIDYDIYLRDIQRLQILGLSLGVVMCIFGALIGYWYKRPLVDEEAVN